MKSPSWLLKTLDQVRRSGREGGVRFTFKALRELAALELGLDETDVCGILAELSEEDFRSRLVSAITLEYLYIFTPKIAGIEIYLKIVVRAHCVVISFHEDLPEGLKDES
jgi:hypothetical protein